MFIILAMQNVKLTKPMERHPKRNRVIQDVKMVLEHFPELKKKVITVGYASNSVGNADSKNSKINLNPDSRGYSFSTIAHELTHILQKNSDIPYGEKACDIWTLARHEMFLDHQPHYLNLPKRVRTDWEAHKHLVRQLCILAIEKRKRGLRQYIVWLENELKGLAG